VSKLQQHVIFRVLLPIVFGQTRMGESAKRSFVCVTTAMLPAHAGVGASLPCNMNRCCKPLYTMQPGCVITHHTRKAFFADHVFALDVVGLFKGLQRRHQMISAAMLPLLEQLCSMWPPSTPATRSVAGCASSSCFP
jgi:hypothetical protein